MGITTWIYSLSRSARKFKYSLEGCHVSDITNHFKNKNMSTASLTACKRFCVIEVNVLLTPNTTQTILVRFWLLPILVKKEINYHVKIAMRYLKINIVIFFIVISMSIHFKIRKSCFRADGRYVLYRQPKNSEHKKAKMCLCYQPFYFELYFFLNKHYCLKQWSRLIRSLKHLRWLEAIQNDLDFFLCHKETTLAEASHLSMGWLVSMHTSAKLVGTVLQ